MNCVNCNRFNSKPVFPLMGDLPKTRVDLPIKAFEDVGLDFAGPFLCRKSPNSHEKSYLALFVCFASKAVHLELVSDLSTAACIAAIRRFVSRRGCPRNLYSDNGKNFVGFVGKILQACTSSGSSSLQELLTLVAYGNQQSSVQRYISEKLWETKFCPLKNYVFYFVELK